MCTHEHALDSCTTSLNITQSHQYQAFQTLQVRDHIHEHLYTKSTTSKQPKYCNTSVILLSRIIAQDKNDIMLGIAWRISKTLLTRS